MSSDDRARSPRRPSRNANRRLPLLLMVGGIAMILAAVLVVPRLFDRTNNDEGPIETVVAAEPGSWARAYIYNGATGEGVAIDPDGSIVERYGEMGRFVDSRVVARSRSVAFLGETIEIGPVPDEEGHPGPYSIPVPEGGEVAVLGVPDRIVLAVHQPAGGNIVIIDADARRSLDVASLLGNPDPKYTLNELQLEPSGEQFAIYNSASDETAVISFSRPQPRFFRHRGLAISSDRIVTSYSEGLTTTATVYASDESVVASFETDPLVGATMDGHTVYFITDKNEILRLEDGATEPTGLTRVPDAKVVALAQNGERLIVDSPWGFAILNRSGAELGQLRPGSGGVENPARNSLCLATDVNELVARDVAGNTVARGPALLRLNDLKLTAVTRLPIHSATSNGCTVSAEVADTKQYQLMSVTSALSLNAAGDIPIVGPYDRMFMSPDPNQWIAMLPDKSVRLFELVDGAATELATIPFPDADYITVAYIASPSTES